MGGKLTKRASGQENDLGIEENHEKNITKQGEYESNIDIEIVILT
jgi:hypothetical protein